MTWREQLGEVTAFINSQPVKFRGGSFRGVPFRTVDAEAQIGRRNQVHEYPQRDVPYTEDLGRRARRFRVEAYVLGDNYLAERDALIQALEASGPGNLTHPRWGSLDVAVADVVNVKESPREGGIAHFSITFVEHGENQFPQATVNTVADLEQLADAADEAAEADFADDFDVSGASVLAEQAISGVGNIQGLTGAVAALLATARQATSVAGLATILGLTGALSNTLTDLVRTPLVLVQALRSIYAELVQQVLRPLSAFAELQMVFFGNTRRGGAALPSSTAARSQENDNARADLNRRLALTNQARLLAVALAQGGAGVVTADQARALRNALLAQIDTELEVNDPPSAVASALGQVRAALVRDVAARSEFLQQRASYTPQAVLPALLLAHTIYQDATRYEELVARNGVLHPAFVPARALEVLV